jgi:hypothetical protein
LLSQRNHRMNYFGRLIRSKKCNAFYRTESIDAIAEIEQIQYENEIAWFC